MCTYHQINNYSFGIDCYYFLILCFQFSFPLLEISAYVEVKEMLYSITLERCEQDSNKYIKEAPPFQSFLLVFIHFLKLSIYRIPGAFVLQNLFYEETPFYDLNQC